MSILSILVFLILTLQCVFSIPSLKETMLSLATRDVDTAWSSFKLRHSRSFKNQTDESKRFYNFQIFKFFVFNWTCLQKRRNIFESNLNKINLHNQKYNNGTVTYSQGITQFSDMVKKLYI